MSIVNKIYIGDEGVSATYVGDTPILLEGSNRVNLENRFAKAYIINTNYSNDPDYTYTDINSYTATGGIRGDWPNPVSIRWNSSPVYSNIRIDISSDEQFTDVQSYYADISAAYKDIYNLIPSRTYHYRVLGIDASNNEETIASGTFETLGMLRMLRIPNCKNFRDIGGWDCDGGTIKYGKLIRGVDVDEPSMAVNSEGIDELINKLKISCEIDFGDNYSSSPLTQYGVEFLNDPTLYRIGAYNNKRTEEYPNILESFTTPSGCQMYKNLLSVIIDRLEHNNVLYLHCNAGCDRTGTLFFLIEALLGMSESDLAKEYELSSFYSQRTRTGYIGGYAPGTVTAYNYKTMIMWLRANFNGNTINEKVYDLCTKSIENGGIGLSAQQINSLRSVMIESNLT